MLPRAILGFNVNQLFAYYTVKYVSIEDHRLGCFYYFLCILIALWVIGFQIVYGNEHYKLYDVEGHTTMTMQQPTRHGCNPRHDDCSSDFKKPEELPYCHGYKGPKVDVEPSECLYSDYRDLFSSPRAPGHMFVPTRVDRILQKRGCDLKRDDPGWCQTMWENVEVHKNTYVADIERFTLMLVSNYARKGIRGTSLKHKGFYYECTDKISGKIIQTEPCHGVLKIQPIECLNNKCDFDTQEDAPHPHSQLQLNASMTFPPSPAPAALSELSGNLRGHSIRVAQKRRSTSFVAQVRNHSLVDSRSDWHSTHSSVAVEVEKDNKKDSTERQLSEAADDRRDVFATKHGDVFRLRKILELAGLDLESYGSYDQTLRSRGTQITIQIEYSNLKPYRSTFPRTGNNPDLDVRYIYRVLKHPINQEKMETYASTQPLDDYHRLINNDHGISIKAQVVGSFGVFNIVYLMVMLTTSLALLGGARALVDALAFYLPTKHQAQYLKARYDVLAEDAVLAEGKTDGNPSQ